MKRVCGQATSEVEHFKYKLIMERHNREKEREQLENQIKELKNSVTTKAQTKNLESELDALKKKLKQAEASSNETPTILLNLQSEMSSMKKKYRNAILEVDKN